MEESSRLGCVVWLARVTWPFIAMVFVATLGGFHPSDHARDTLLVTASLVVLALNAPVIFSVVRRDGEPGQRWLAVGGLVLRVATAASVFWFIHGISHEHRGREPSALHSSSSTARSLAIFEAGEDAARPDQMAQCPDSVLAGST